METSGSAHPPNSRVINSFKKEKKKHARTLSAGIFGIFQDCCSKTILQVHVISYTDQSDPEASETQRIYTEESVEGVTALMPLLN